MKKSLRLVTKKIPTERQAGVYINNKVDVALFAPQCVYLDVTFAYPSSSVDERVLLEVYEFQRNPSERRRRRVMHHYSAVRRVLAAHPEQLGELPNTGKVSADPLLPQDLEAMLFEDPANPPDTPREFGHEPPTRSFRPTVELRRDLCLPETYLGEALKSDTVVERVLTALKDQGSRTPSVYRALASIVRAQNTGTSFKPDHEEYAHWLEWTAGELQFENKISKYNRRIKQKPDDKEAYLGILSTLLDKRDGQPKDDEREYALYTVFKAVECGGTKEVITLAEQYARQGKYVHAEFILAKLKDDNIQDPRAYLALHLVVRAQNTGISFNQDREDYAKWLEWKVKEVSDRTTL